MIVRDVQLSAVTICRKNRASSFPESARATFWIGSTAFDEEAHPAAREIAAPPIIARNLRRDTVRKSSSFMVVLRFLQMKC